MIDETRLQPNLADDQQEQSKRFGLDEHRNQLVLDGRIIALSPLATRLLALLARKPGAVVERSAIISELWHGNHLVGEAALNRVVSEIRRAVGDDRREPRVIQTIPRCGYRLINVGSVSEVTQAGTGAGAPVRSRRLLIAAAAAAVIVVLFILLLTVLENLIAIQAMSARS